MKKGEDWHQRAIKAEGAEPSSRTEEAGSPLLGDFSSGTPTDEASNSLFVLESKLRDLASQSESSDAKVKSKAFEDLKRQA